LKITNEYRGRYERISKIIDANRAIVEAVHKDLRKLLKSRSVNGPGRKCKITSDTVLRIIICQRVEGETLRGIVIRIDDSNFLRFFVRICNDAMVDYSTLCTLRNAIREKTWKKINSLLRDSAVESELIDGSRLRTDTTAYEANIHWPTDSGLLWDTYRVLSRLVLEVRELDPDAASGRKLQVSRAKKLSAKIARQAGKKREVTKELKARYPQLIELVDSLLNWIPSVCERLQRGLERNAYEFYASILVGNLIEQMEYFHGLGLKVVDQASRRVINGEVVPNEEKIFSIFEPHTELLIRGKAGKPIEFGHMVLIQQVEDKFITDYEVFRKRPVDFELVDPILESHKETFGKNPDEFSADKGFYESMAKIKELEEDIGVVSIAKKGKRTEEETERETTKEFKLGQMFRAGVEGTISVLKRVLGMSRCMRKGWDHYASSVGEAVFVHNLLTLEPKYG
jgi:IS5 family transposase